jgi:all-trans-retinol 13,14-reductase
MKKTGQSYKQVLNLDTNFDGIVIGSGIGGLCAAALLAKEGKKILLLEQHYVVGGFTHVFQRKDYEWDVGLHYIGGVDSPKSVLRKTFDYISNKQLAWASMDDVYDKAVFGDKEYAFCKGKDNFKTQLKTYFTDPKDQQAIDQYFALLTEVENVGIGYYAEKILPSFIANIAGSLLRRGVMKYADQTTRAVLSKITNNEALIGVLTTQYGDYGLPPAQSSFFMHAMVANHYMDGGAYPVGGPSSIAHSIAAVIEANGGLVLHSAEVKAIVVEKNTAIGVQMDDGKTIHAPLIISDAGIKNTFLHLLDANIQQKHHLADKIEPLTPSVAHVCLYIGLKKSAKDLGLPKCNYWVFPPNYNHDENIANYRQPSDPLPVSYISFPSAKDPEWESRYPNKSTIEVITLAPYEWFKTWENEPWKKRGDDYEAFKEQIAQQLLQSLYQIMPHLNGQIDYYELSTPLSTRKFDHNDSGEIYGLAHSPQRFKQRVLRPTTPIKNLYLTGQDVLSAGIGGALMGGVICVSAILGKNMLSRVSK